MRFVIRTLRLQTIQDTQTRGQSRVFTGASTHTNGITGKLIRKSA
jgi:hypothetical protein